ncbi:MAG: hypothetical protein AB1696_13775 [Planctomycetota bacterium]
MIRIEKPFHGAVLNRRHGQEVNGGLQIEVAGEAPLWDKVMVNGQVAHRAGGRFSAGVILRERGTDIVATSEGPFGQSQHRIRVVWDKKSFPRYRFSIDDNSFFLRDIAQKRYKSLFDCFYLRILQNLNKKYDAKFVLNIYYTTGDDFSLPLLSDKYKGEWADNAHWLKLSFHAYANLPDRPYQYASAAKLASDYDLVEAEVRRFASDDTWSPPTVIHWGMLQPAVLPVLVERGVRVLSGTARTTSGGYDVNYMLDEARSDYLSRHDALKDFVSGIVYSHIDICCNNVPLDQTKARLEPLLTDPDNAEIMDLFTHEQYFWPFYQRHVPDHADRLNAAIGFCAEHGYKPVFFHEGFLGAPE